MSGRVIEFRPGKRLGHFEILRTLNKGGQAMVYLARLWKPVSESWHEVVEHLDQHGASPELIERYKLCVIKVADPDWVENLRDEWDYLLQIRKTHKHSQLVQTFTERFGDIVSVRRGVQVDFAFVEVSSPKGGTLRLPYIVLAYEPGGALSQVLEQRGGQPVPPPCVVQIARQVAEVLCYLHEQVRLVHHDISPSNILLRQPFSPLRSNMPEVILTDLAVADSLDYPRLRTVYGKKLYLPPERLPGSSHNDASSQISPQIDIYGLGMVMYEMLAGRISVPRTEDILDPSSALPPIRERNPRVSAELNKLVMQAIDRDPRRRQGNLPTMRQMLTQLDAVPEARQRCWMHGKWNPVRVRRMVLRAGVGVGILLVLLVAVLTAGTVISQIGSSAGTTPASPSVPEEPTLTPLPMVTFTEIPPTPTPLPTSTMATSGAVPTSTMAPTPTDTPTPTNTPIPPTSVPVRRRSQPQPQPQPQPPPQPPQPSGGG